MMKDLLVSIEKILKSPDDESWTSRWLGVLKDSAMKNKSYPPMPKYGYGDKVSYSIMEGAISRFVDKNKNGAIRHGAECFNYYFPQEIDDHFLVVSDTLPETTFFKYVPARDLIGILCDRIEEGFCFPLNPKWIIADKGWKMVYDKMLKSNSPIVQRALESWYPQDSGVRELFEAIHARFPNGFERTSNKGSWNEAKEEGMDAMNLAKDELRRFVVLRRAKLKLRSALLLCRISPNNSNTKRTGNLIEEEKPESNSARVSKKKSTVQTVAPFIIAATAI